MENNNCILFDSNHEAPDGCFDHPIFCGRIWNSLKVRRDAMNQPREMRAKPGIIGTQKERLEEVSKSNHQSLKSKTFKQNPEYALLEAVFVHVKLGSF